ncbi:MAG: DNA replication/repair protein RecF [Gemmatimonas sp.]
MTARVRTRWREDAAVASQSRYAVRRLALTDYRCYPRLRLEVDERPVVLYGANGAGKTNLLEALSFLAPGRGLRGANLGEVDRFGGGPWAVAASISAPGGDIDIGTGRTSGDEKTDKRAVRVNGAAAPTAAELAERLAVVWLTPAMDRLFLDSPSARRKFLDRLVFAFDPAHATRVNSYERALRERARLLRDRVADDAWLSALETQMAERGVAVAAARIAMAEALNATAAAREGAFPVATMALVGSVEEWLGEGPALAAEDRFREALRASRGEDTIAGGAAIGPHRSDIVVRHRARGTPADLMSTGEQKTLLLGLVLAHARLIADERGAAPLLLLDEVAAHLDDRHRQALYGEIRALGAQVWLTGTDAALFTGLQEEAQFFAVADATLTAAN